jgi:hypothetical protein
MIKLPDVTLIALSSIKIPETIHALEISMREIEFADVKLVTDKEFQHAHIKRELCPLMDNVDKYNEYAFLHLGDHISTSHALIIQYDSWVIRPTLWRNDWLWWDYIGAGWKIVPDAYIANNGERVRVGNGGFSLRSKRLMTLPKEKGWELRSEQGWKNEDGNIVCYWRKEFLEMGIKYAPIDVAVHFSFENELEENCEVDSFGFHKNIRWGWQKEIPLK